MSLLLRLESSLPSTTITIKGKPYLTRCYLFGADRRWGNTYLHHFHMSDQGEDLHSHPWMWGLSYVLAGGYSEERVEKPFFWESKTTRDTRMYNVPVGNIQRRIFKPGRFNFIRSTDFHRVDLLDEAAGAWSLFFTGPRTQDWGFLNRQTSEFTDWRNNPEAIP